MQYKRVLLKLSGEALMGTRQYGIDPQRLKEYAKEIKGITVYPGFVRDEGHFATEEGSKLYKLFLT